MRLRRPLPRNPQTRHDARTPRRQSVLYLAPGDVAKGRVEPITWMQTCSAYAARGLEVVLVTLQVRRPDGQAADRIWSHYGLEPKFRVCTFPSPLRRHPPLWWFRLWAGIAALTYALRTGVVQIFRPRDAIIHARAPVSIGPFLLLNSLLPASRRTRLVFETHSLPRLKHSWIVRRVDLVVTNSDKLASDVCAYLGVAQDRVVHVPLGPHNRIRAGSKSEARARLGLALDSAVACYA
jgi:hypothetical protein